MPIKVVIAQDSDYFVPESGGGSRTVFGEVTGELRQSLSDQVSTVERDFADSFKRFPDVPAVAKVKLKKEALAKSHRPHSLFSDRTCPITCTTTTRTASRTFASAKSSVTACS
ncbi:MAG: hypothetical protein U0105_04710 [Candidatus Obscuribacterales bacterium]